MYLTMLGNLGADIEKRMTPNGKELYSGSLAYKKSKDDEATWVKLTFSKAFEYLVPYLKKGTKLMVQGRLSPPRVSEKNGKAYLDVWVSYCDLAGDKKESNEEDVDF